MIVTEIFEPYYDPYNVGEKDLIVVEKNARNANNCIVYHRLSPSKWCILVGHSGKIRVGSNGDITNKDIKTYTKMALDNGDRVFEVENTLYYEIPSNFINIPAKSFNAHRVLPVHKPVSRKPTVRKPATRKPTRK